MSARFSRLDFRFHGRGGQGAVTASKILAEALLGEGRWVLAFSAFGGARRGAPVAAFVRTASEPIRERCLVYRPDWVVVLDPGLIDSVDVLEGLGAAGGVLVNGPRMPAGIVSSIATGRPGLLWGNVDAAGIAGRLGVGSKAAPIVNTVMLGALARLSGIVGVDSLARAADKALPWTAGKNMEALDAGWTSVVGRSGQWAGGGKCA